MRVCPVSRFLSVIVTPGNGAFVGSVTLPRIVPVMTWAVADGVRHRSARMMKTTALRDVIRLLAASKS